MSQFSKARRKIILAKYGSRCSYCGKKITYSTMQVDHYWPKFLAHLKPDMDINCDENLKPSCRKCNNFKSSLRPEQFRIELEKQVQRLLNNPQFDRALRFGQLKITEKPIIFYFEKFEKRKRHE